MERGSDFEHVILRKDEKMLSHQLFKREGRNVEINWYREWNYRFQCIERDQALHAENTF